jgi:hydroxyversicolorone monooxygenase
MIKTPRWEDYDIEYLKGSPAEKNMWAFMGMGTVRALVEKLDVSPYLTVENIDPEWMRALNIDDTKIIEAKVERVKKENRGVQSTSEQGSGLKTKQGGDTSGLKDVAGDK